MSTATWDKEEIKKLALISGRPLEVQCAEEFLKARWKVRLGTFFTDLASDKIRELDFLAEKTDLLPVRTVSQDSIDIQFKVRILGSCKGFLPEHCPVTYSVLPNSGAVEPPALICYEVGIFGRRVADSMKQDGARYFMRRAGLSDAQQIVGFDIFQRKEKDQKQSPSGYEYSRKGDRDLYEGLDSAIKAAIFWHREDKRRTLHLTANDRRGYIALNISLLVTSLPFWNISIHKGAAEEPEIKGSGIHVGLYPSGDIERPPEATMSIIWEAANLAKLISHLADVRDEFIDEIKLRLPKYN